jgi:hypothetical protein
MNKYLFLCVIGLLFLIFSCSAKKGENMQKTDSPKPSLPYPQETVAPGNVDLTARFISVEEDSTTMFYHVIVDKVHAHGMGSRPIAEGTEIIVILDKTRIISDSLLMRKLTQKDQLMRMTVREGKGKMDQRNIPVWQIRKIK